ncbi:MAG TPA: hypothetical protein VIF57_16010 [Polyangia bacterium]
MARRLIGSARREVLISVALLALAACRRTPAAPAGVAFDLPDAIAGFVAGAREPGDGWVRRTYAAGGTRITVTLARHAMDDAAWDSWVRMSSAGFPQADLELPPGAANGFYQCDDRAPDRCDLLIQLRSGVHVEIRGGGTSTRRDVDAIRRGLPLAALAADAGAATR